MSVNYLVPTNEFERRFEQHPPKGDLRFTPKDPHQFDSLKSLLAFNKRGLTPQNTSHVEFFPGVSFDWVEGRESPIVTLEDFAINEDAQLFLQVYGDTLIEEQSMPYTTSLGASL